MTSAEPGRSGIQMRRALRRLSALMRHHGPRGESGNPSASMGLAGTGRRAADFDPPPPVSLRPAKAAQSSGLLTAVLAGADIGIFAVDDSGAILHVNPAALELLDAGDAAFVGRSALALLRDHDAFRELVQCLDDRLPRATMLASSLAKRAIRLALVPLDGPAPWSLVAYLYDVTSVRDLEGIRREFVSNVSHELRTPLASIKAVIEVLQAGALEELDVARDFLVRLDEEVDRLTQMVEEMLELGRIEAAQPSAPFDLVDVAGVVHSCVRRLAAQAERAHVTLADRVGGPLPPVRGDAEWLERAVVNLVHNAIKFTPAGGDVAVHAFLRGDGVDLVVEDTGIGIPAADLPHIFERFYKARHTRDARGTGLGLAIVKHVAEAHGGTITAQSTVGVGSTFTLHLPALTTP